MTNNDSAGNASGKADGPGRTCVVTGGCRGIGRAITQRLLRDGMKVAVFDVEPEEAAFDEFAGRAERLLLLRCDVSDRSEVRQAVGRTVDAFGPPGKLVNNAGVGRRATFLELEDHAWDTVLGVNLKAAFVVSQEVGRLMARHGGGAIVNIGSVSAHLAFSGQAAYSASKAGLEGLSRVMAFDLAPMGIRVNTLSPGTIETELLSTMMSDEARSERIGRIPAARLGTSDEMASAVAFLLSDEARYITGSVLTADGGQQIAGIRE